MKRKKKTGNRRSAMPRGWWPYREDLLLWGLDKNICTEWLRRILNTLPEELAPVLRTGIIRETDTSSSFFTDPDRGIFANHLGITKRATHNALRVRRALWRQIGKRGLKVVKA